MEEKRPKVGLGAIVYRNGKILIGERRDGHGSGTMMIPGGHLEFGETFEECALREATEETGLTDLTPKGVISVGNDIAYDKHYVSIGVLLISNTGEPHDAEPTKGGNWRWVDPKDLPANMFPHSKKVIENWLNNTIYSQ